MRPHWQPLIDRLRNDDRRRCDAARHRTHPPADRRERRHLQRVCRPARARTGPGRWIRCRSCCRPPSGGRSRRASRSARGCSNALLADLYGPQQLLAEGLVPPELPFGHPNFLWPCHGIVPPAGTWLHIYAADLARAPDGRWWVLADRTQAPSGPAMRWKTAKSSSRCCPTPIRDLRRAHAARLLRRAARATAGACRRRTRARWPWCSRPGPFNETYFEHAYLARQLGLPLVGGHDLTVRDDTVYLKTLAGLQARARHPAPPGRRLLRSAGAAQRFGARRAGLLGAVRAGRVVRGQRAGHRRARVRRAGWAFCRGSPSGCWARSCMLPSVATWWCGEQPALEYVLAHLNDLVIKPTYPNQQFRAGVRPRAGGPRARCLIARMRARPYAYVAQEHLAFSQAPVLAAAPGCPGFAAKAVTIRVYAHRHRRKAAVMPGGLARVATDASDRYRLHAARRRQQGHLGAAGSRSARRGRCRDGSRRGHAPPRARIDMPSRLVENLYWMGRYTVRCEDKARLLRATLGGAGRCAGVAHRRAHVSATWT